MTNTENTENTETETTAPTEFEGMAWPEIVEILDEQAREEVYAREAQERIPHRWQ